MNSFPERRRTTPSSWVTIFGVPKNAIPSVLKILATVVGQIDNCVAGPPEGNVFFVKFKSSSDAETALGLHGTEILGNVIFGVKELDPETVIDETDAQHDWAKNWGLTKEGETRSEEDERITEDDEDLLNEEEDVMFDPKSPTIENRITSVVAYLASFF